MRNGIRICKPTSVAVTGSGSSASIVGQGSVTFASATGLSLNGVFTSDFDNYIVVVRHSGSTAGTTLTGRLRASGSDASASNYVRQYLYANGTSVTAARESTQSEFRIGATDSTLRSGDTVYFYGPLLAQPTAIRNIGIYAASGGQVLDAVSTHSLSTAYDGVTVFPASGTITGLISVYGLVN